MTALSIPALVSFVLKLGLLIYALRAPRHDTTTRLFMFFVGLQAVHNLIEILGFNEFGSHGVATVTAEGARYGYAYFAVIAVAIAVGLHVSLRISIDRWDTARSIVPVIYAPVPILEYLLLGTDKLVSGFISYEGFTILRVPGPWYGLFEAYAIVYPLAIIAYLIYGARRSRTSSIARVRNRLWLLALLPLLALHLYLIVANHFGLAKISSTISIPIAMTFFLIVATYAIHEYRLFDIEFFIPWSKIRKRKTEFYERIRTMIAAISELRSIPDLLQRLANTLRCQVALIGGPQPAVAFVVGQDRAVNPDLEVTKFPRALLAQVRHIVVAQEIAERQPDLYAAMRQYDVGAIVPFKAHNTADPRWMLLGNHFGEQVYTPLDFKMVETLFAAMADRFLDDFLLVKSELAETKEELRCYKHRLALAWDQSAELRAENHALRKESAQLHADNAQLRREQLHVIRDDLRPLPAEVVSGRKTMRKYLDDLEAKMIRAALDAARGDKNQAAEFLGIGDLRALHYMMERHGIESNEFLD